MSRLEQTVAAELARVPPGPSSHELRRRARVRRARRVIGPVAAVVLVLAGVGAGVLLRPSASARGPRRVQITQPAPTSTTLGRDVDAPGLGAIPKPTREPTPLLGTIRQSVLQFLSRNFSPRAAGSLVVSAKIVGTTRGRADALLSGLPGTPNARVWVVEVVGTFPWVCNACVVPRGGTRPHGHDLTFVFDGAGKRLVRSFGDNAPDLGRLGTVYALGVGTSVSR